MNTTSRPTSIRQHATKEIALLTGFLFIGLVVMPFVVYQVGQTVFGEYGGVGYGDFFGTLSGKVRNGEFVAWFLTLSPYIGWQCLRLMVFGWRITGRQKETA